MPPSPPLPHACKDAPHQAAKLHAGSALLRPHPGCGDPPAVRPVSPDVTSRAGIPSCHCCCLPNPDTSETSCISRPEALRGAWFAWRPPNQASLGRKGLASLRPPGVCFPRGTGLESLASECGGGLPTCEVCKRRWPWPPTSTAGVCYKATTRGVITEKGGCESPWGWAPVRYAEASV